MTQPLDRSLLIKGLKVLGDTIEQQEMDYKALLQAGKDLQQAIENNTASWRYAMDEMTEPQNAALIRILELVQS